MQITSLNNAQIPQANIENRPPRPDGPPPKGAIPPGLENAVDSLTEEEQTLTTEMLASLSKEQHQELKSFLDELKPLTEDLSAADTGNAFFSALSQIYQQGLSQTDGSDNQSLVDTYA